MATIQVDVRQAAERPRRRARTSGWRACNIAQHAQLAGDPPGPRGLGRGRARSRGRERPADRRAPCREAIARGGRPDARRRGPGRPRRHRSTRSVGPVRRTRGSSRRPLRQGASRAVRRVRPVAGRALVDLARSSRSRSTGRRGSASTRCRRPGSRRSARRSASRTASRSSRGRSSATAPAFLVVPVNNASYGTTAASAQHLQMSQMRAVENGRWVVDAAVSGISAFVDPTGASWSQAGLFRAGDPAAHDPVLGRAHVVRPAGGLVPVALLLRSSPGWCCCLAGARASGPRPEPLSPDRAGRS